MAHMNSLCLLAPHPSRKLWTMVSRVQGEDTPILLTLVPRLPLDVGWEMGIQGSLTSGV